MTQLAFEGLRGSPPPDVSSIGLMSEGTARSWAAFAPDRRYRHLLGRAWWDAGVPSKPRIMVWCCLNPSTADALDDDPSVRRMIGFAERERCKGILLVNLFGWRTPYAKELPGVADPVGPLNDAAIRWAFGHNDAAIRIAGWGRIGTKKLRALAASSMDLVFKCGASCFGWTVETPKQPRHPLMLPANTPLEADGARYWRAG